MVNGSPRNAFMSSSREISSYPSVDTNITTAEINEQEKLKFITQSMHVLNVLLCNSRTMKHKLKLTYISQ